MSGYVVTQSPEPEAHVKNAQLKNLVVWLIYCFLNYKHFDPSSNLLQCSDLTQLCYTARLEARCSG